MFAHIKKYRWIVVSCCIAAGVIIYLSWGGIYQWFHIDRHIKNVEVLIDSEGKKCGAPKAVYIKIFNNSSKTIERMTIYLKLTEVGFSEKLNWDDKGSVSYKIIKPNESHDFCTFLFGKWDWKNPLDTAFRNIEIEKTEIVFLP